MALRKAGYALKMAGSAKTAWTVLISKDGGGLVHRLGVAAESKSFSEPFSNLSGVWFVQNNNVYAEQQSNSVDAFRLGDTVTLELERPSGSSGTLRVFVSGICRALVPGLPADGVLYPIAAALNQQQTVLLVPNPLHYNAASTAVEIGAAIRLPAKPQIVAAHTDGVPLAAASVVETAAAAAEVRSFSVRWSLNPVHRQGNTVVSRDQLTLSSNGAAQGWVRAQDGGFR